MKKSDDYGNSITRNNLTTCIIAERKPMDKEQVLRQMWELLVRTYHEFYPENNNVSCICNFFSNKTWCYFYDNQDMRTSNGTPVCMEWFMDKEDSNG